VNLVRGLPVFFFGYTIYLFLILLLFILPVTLQPFDGHDSQRIAQILVALLCIGLLLANGSRIPRIKRQDRVIGLVILGGGIISALASAQPLWSLVELALLIACCGIASAFALARVSHDSLFDKVMVIFVVLLCLLKCTGFLASTAAAFSSGTHILDTDLLLDAFSNKRFYGQFQTFTLPLLAMPLVLPCIKRSTKAWVFGLLACWWMIAICGGTRGTWLGMGVAAAVLAFCGRQGRRTIAWQLLAVVSGILLFWLLFSVLPGYLGVKVVNFAGDRLNASLSAREVIWSQAWEMIQQQPLLGFGPMQFASIFNPVAAHPHQAVLQWACEWGIPSTLLIIWLIIKGIRATFVLIRKNENSNDPVDVIRVCLFASLVGALTQSMVDGVMVMPYSQLWLALIVGWLFGIHEHPVGCLKMVGGTRHAWLGIQVISLMLLSYVVIRDVPHLEEREDQFARDFGGNYQPRFWRQGIITQPHAKLFVGPRTASFVTETPK
jgi:O-antigen ligase